MVRPKTGPAKKEVRPKAGPSDPCPKKWSGQSRTCRTYSYAYEPGSTVLVYSSICIYTVYIYKYKRASLASTPRLADTKCPPDAPFGRLWLPLINYMGDNISKYACPTVIIDIARKSPNLSIFKMFSFPSRSQTLFY